MKFFGVISEHFRPFPILGYTTLLLDPSIVDTLTMLIFACTASKHHCPTLAHHLWPSLLLRVNTTQVQGKVAQTPQSCIYNLTECPPNLCPVGWYIDVDNATVGATGSQPLEGPLHAAGEDAAGEALLHLVVPLNGLVHALARYHVIM